MGNPWETHLYRVYRSDREDVFWHLIQEDLGQLLMIINLQFGILVQKMFPNQAICEKETQCPPFKADKLHHF